MDLAVTQVFREKDFLQAPSLEQQELQAEEMITVGMGDVNSYEILAARDDPIYDRDIEGAKPLDKLVIHQFELDLSRRLRHA